MRSKFITELGSRKAGLSVGKQPYTGKLLGRMLARFFGSVNTPTLSVLTGGLSKCAVKIGRFNLKEHLCDC